MKADRRDQSPDRPLDLSPVSLPLVEGILSTAATWRPTWRSSPGTTWPSRSPGGCPGRPRCPARPGASTRRRHRTLPTPPQPGTGCGRCPGPCGTNAFSRERRWLRSDSRPRELAAKANSPAVTGSGSLTRRNQHLLHGAAAPVEAGSVRI